MCDETAKCMIMMISMKFQEDTNGSTHFIWSSSSSHCWFFWNKILAEFENRLLKNDDCKVLCTHNSRCNKFQKVNGFQSSLIFCGFIKSNFKMTRHNFQSDEWNITLKLLEKRRRKKTTWTFKCSWNLKMKRTNISFGHSCRRDIETFSFVWSLKAEPMPFNARLSQR